MCVLKGRECVCVYGDMVILESDSQLIYGIDLDEEWQAGREGRMEQRRTVSVCV